MPTLNVQLPDSSDSLYMKVPDTTDSVHVKLPEDPTVYKLTHGGGSITTETFINYDVSDWSILPDASPMPSGDINAIEYNSAGTLLAVGKAAPPLLIIYDAATLIEVPGPTIPVGTAVVAVAFNKAGTLLAVSSESTVYIYDTSDWSSVTDLTLPARVETLDFNYAGTLLAVGISGFGGTYLYIYNTATWGTIVGPSGGDEPEGAVVALDFSPDDTLLAVANQFSLTRNLTIYNTSTWNKLADPAGVTTAQALDCVFNNAQTELLFLQASGTYLVRWDTSTWTILGGTPTLPAQPVCIAINTDDSYVAVGLTQNPTSTFLVYDTSTWNLESVPVPPNRRITAVDFQPTGP